MNKLRLHKILGYQELISIPKDLQQELKNTTFATY